MSARQRRWFVSFTLSMLLASLVLPVQADDWWVGKIVGLCKGTHIYYGPDESYGYHTIVPEDDWAVKIIGGPRGDWWDTSRREAGDPSGGTGWVKKSEAESCKQPSPPQPPPSPAQVVLTAGLSISNTRPRPGEWVNATFSVKNVGGETFRARFFGVKGRGPGDSDYSFFWMENFTLEPGQEYRYDTNRSFDQVGSYWFTPNYSPDGSDWTDIKWPDGRTSYVTIEVIEPSEPGRLQMVGGLNLSTPSPQVGEQVIASFTVRNVGGQPFVIRRMVAGARGPDAHSLEWSAPNVDFPAVTDITLDPGQEYTYRQSRSFDQAGDYFAEPVVMDESGHWGGIPPFSRVWFDVREPPPTLTPPVPEPVPTPPQPPPPEPGRLQMVGGLSLSTPSPQVGEQVIASFTVRNVGGQPFVIRRMVAGARGPDAHSLEWSAPNVDFPAVTDITLDPGQEYTYRQSRSFDQAGDYFAEPVVMDESGHWGGIPPFPRVWFDVREQPPVPPPPPSTGPCSETVIRDYLRRQGSPLAEAAAAFVSAGRQYDVDPRFVVAIANAESSLGTNGRCATERHNAWGYGGGWPSCWTFNSWEEAIQQVTMDIGVYYFRRYNQRTIPAFVKTPAGTCTTHCWCASRCEHWIANTSEAYQEMGGNPQAADLSFTAACQSQPSPPQPTRWRFPLGKDGSDPTREGYVMWYGFGTHTGSGQPSGPCFGGKPLRELVHAGEDWGGPGWNGIPNAEVRAIADGVLYEDALQDWQPGRALLIYHEEAGIWALYGHLSNDLKVSRKGERVKVGDVLGYVLDQGGYSHLHFEIHTQEPITWRCLDGSTKTDNWGAGYVAEAGDLQSGGYTDPSAFIRAQIGSHGFAHPTLSHAAGTISQGETRTAGQVTVPPNQKSVQFVMRWTGSTLELVVTDPQGQQVDEQYNGAQWLREATRVVLTVQQPLPGDWSMSVVGKEVSEAEEPYEILVVGENIRESEADLALAVISTVVILAVVGGGILTARSGPGSFAAGSAPELWLVHGNAIRPALRLSRSVVSIGRDPRSALVLSDPQVSAQHAQIVRQANRYVLYDLNSTNGTFVNGQRITQHLLREGDRICVGTTEIVFRAKEVPAGRPAPSVAPMAGEAYLSAKSGPYAGTRLRLKGPVTALGRDPSCDIVLADDKVSRHHAEIRLEASGYTIYDLQSRNGTLVNRQRIERQTLRDGDEIQIGQSILIFHRG